MSLKASPQQIADKFADLSGMQSLVDQMPDEERQRVGDVKFTKDTITIAAPAVGEMCFTVTQRSEQGVRLEASQPLPMALFIDLETEGDGSRATTGIDIELPMMLRPLLGPQLQKAAQQFGKIMTRIAE